MFCQNSEDIAHCFIKDMFINPESFPIVSLKFLRLLYPVPDPEAGVITLNQDQTPADQWDFQK